MLRRHVRHQRLNVKRDELSKPVRLRHGHRGVIRVRVGVDAHGRIVTEHLRRVRRPPLPQRRLGRLPRVALVRHERVELPRLRSPERVAGDIRQLGRRERLVPQVREARHLRGERLQRPRDVLARGVDVGAPRRGEVPVRSTRGRRRRRIFKTYQNLKPQPLALVGVGQDVIHDGASHRVVVIVAHLVQQRREVRLESFDGERPVRVRVRRRHRRDVFEPLAFGRRRQLCLVVRVRAHAVLDVVVVPDDGVRQRAAGVLVGGWVLARGARFGFVVGGGVFSGPEDFTPR